MTPSAGSFRTTRWSVVLAAQLPDSPDARRALETLCEGYWYPLYAYTRRRGHSHSDAEDLSLGYFARLLEKRDLEDVDPSRGRFRSFLLASLKHYLSNQADRERAAKRGGGRKALAIDMSDADQRYQLVDPTAHPPDRLFDRAWALALLERVLETLRREYAERGRGALFDEIEGAITPSGGIDAYKEVAARLGTTEGAIKIAVHRLRADYGAALRAEIADTLSEPDAIDGELDALFRALE